MSSTLYCVDVETTGIDLKNDRLIQLAFLKVRDGNIEAFNDLCYTDVEISEQAMAVHRITPAMLEDKYWPEETESFLELERGNVPENFFISHGNELDKTMLAHEELEIVMQCIDTDRCARQLLSDARSFKLENLIEQYGLAPKARKIAAELGIENIDAHDALSDALWHYALFDFLLQKAGGDIERLVELTAKPQMLEKITFGKHKNKTFEAVMQKDPLDMVWMYVNIAPDWEDLDYTLTYWLKTKEYFWKKAQKERKEAMAIRL